MTWFSWPLPARTVFPLCLAWASCNVHADIVQLRPIADTTLIETSPDNNMGGQPFFNAGTTGIDTLNRGLLMFDLTGVIPQNSIIEEVDLFLEVVGSPASNQGEISLFGIHRVLLPWGEGDKTQSFSPGLGEPATLGEATWNHRFAGTDETWSVPGGAPGVDYVANPSALTFVVFEDQYAFESSTEMIADVQGWLDHPEENHGWMLKTLSEDTRFTARRFGSSEDPFAYPVLSVQFTTVPEPSTITLGLLGLIAWGWMRRRARH